MPIFLFAPGRAALRLFLLSVSASLLGVSGSLANEFVRLDYNLELQDHGLRTVILELFDDRPLSRDNFLQYVDADRYNGVIMHRLAKDFVLQGGGFYEDLIAEPPPVNVSLNPNATVDLDGNPATDNPTVDNEFDNVPFRSNLRGTVSYAKVGAQYDENDDLIPGTGPDSATNQFFFNLGDNSTNLDNQNGGFTAFAEVRGNGMTLIDAYNGLGVTNLNPDIDDNGTRDGGPFGNNSTDGVPFFGSSLVRIENASRTMYYGAGDNIDVPDAHMDITEDTIIDVGATFTATGSGTGRVQLQPGATLETYDGATIGTVFTNAGELRVGMQTGIFNVGTYIQSIGDLHLDLAGTTPGEEYDQIVASGNILLLDGAMHVDLDYTPENGDSFTLLKTNGVFIGAGFDAIHLPILQDGFVWDYEQTTTEIILTAAKADFDKSGTVDQADYFLWRSTFGSTTQLDADANGDNVVDAADYAVWRNNLGNANGSGSPALAPFGVPEPSGAMLALIGLAVFGARRWN